MTINSYESFFLYTSYSVSPPTMTNDNVLYHKVFTVRFVPYRCHSYLSNFKATSGSSLSVGTYIIHVGSIVLPTDINWCCLSLCFLIYFHLFVLMFTFHAHQLSLFILLLVFGWKKVTNQFNPLFQPNEFQKVTMHPH